MKRKKYACLYGFNRSDPNETGYFAIGPDGGYTVTKDRASAKRFDLKKPRGAEGWAPPGKWLEFFGSEMPDWKFHVVRFFAD